MKQNIKIYGEDNLLDIRNRLVINVLIDKLKLVFDENAIKEGWCTWPMNFDPIWVKNCGIKEYLKGTVLYENIMFNSKINHFLNRENKP